MKLDNRYSIDIVVVGYDHGYSGDCYGDMASFLREHPNTDYRFAYIIVETETGKIPSWYANQCDWSDTVDEAVEMYLSNLKLTDDINKRLADPLYLLKAAEIVLNTCPMKKISHSDFKDSYEVTSAIGKYLRENSK